MEQIRPNGQRARNAVMLIWMVMAWDVIALFSGYLQYDLLQSALNGGEISPVTATANDTREQVVGLIHTMVYLISVVTFILWFRRAYFNHCLWKWKKKLKWPQRVPSFFDGRFLTVPA